MTHDFTIKLSDQERREIAKTLGRLLHLLDSPINNGSAVEQTPAVVAPRVPASIEARDRWEHDKQGKEIPIPEAEAYTCRIWKCTQQTGKRGPFLDVRWEQRRAYCFDQKLFPWIMQASAEHRPIVLYLKEDGNFTNVVGVRA